MYVRKEAVLSSQIEGTQSSLQNLLAAEARLHDPDAPADVSEVVNYVRAMNHGLARLAELPVSVRLILEIHAELMRGARGGRLAPGEVRTSQNWIGPAGCTLQEAAFVPPPPHEVPQALSGLERFLHAANTLPVLVQVGLAHAQFETIHPFLDGNGRLGRLLITFLLTERKRLARPVLYLSHYLKRHRAAGNGHRILEQLFDHPIVTVATVRSWLGITSAGANQLVSRLVEAGVLREITGYARTRRFRFDPYLRLFEEPEEIQT